VADERAEQGAELEKAELDEAIRELEQDADIRSRAAALDHASERASALIQELRLQRDTFKLTQSEVARRIGTSQPAVARLEAGLADPKLSTLQRWAAVFGRVLNLELPDAEASHDPEIARRVVTSLLEARDRRDLRTLGELYAADCDWSFSGVVNLHGADQIVDFEQSLFEAFPDMRTRVERVIPYGSTCVVEGYARGTHSGTLRLPTGPIPPTGLPMRTLFVDIVDVRDGKIARETLLFDQFVQLVLMAQLGQMTPVAPAMA